MSSKFRREYVCYYDGQQEEMYFKHFGNLIKQNFPNASVKFNEKAKFQTLSKLSTAMTKIAVFDYDKEPKQFERRIKTRGIITYYTNLNFDLWILLHKKPYDKCANNNDGYVDEIRKTYKLEETADIKNENVIKSMLKQITLKDVRRAIKNAEDIMKKKLDVDKKYTNKKVENKTLWYCDNPSMNIHKFFSEILDEVEKKK